MTAQDFTNPYPAQLLDDYLTIYSRRDPASMGNTIIRHQEFAHRHLSARLVLGDKGTLQDLLVLGRQGGFKNLAFTADDIEPDRLVSLARVIALQNILPSDLQDALSLYHLAEREYGPDRIAQAHQNLHTQLAYHLRELDKLKRLMKRYRRMFTSIRNTLNLNLANPYHSGSRSWKAWFEQLQELMPPAKFTMGDQLGVAALDRLSAQPLAYCSDDTMVSVAITCFKPSEQLITAVRSIVSQSWRNLEVLLLDDGSPAEYHGILEHCEQLDGRIRLVMMPHNGGTYVARNQAMDLARGEFLTFQDSDDWCHPNRIEYQVSLMKGDPSLMATVTNGLKVNDDLTIDRVGRPVNDISMPTTMLRLAEVKARAGYFHAIRKSADGEYLDRIRAAFGANSVHHEKSTAYKLIRQGEGSLSRSDFGTGGWMHPAREAYKSAQVYWHNRIKAGEADPYLSQEDNQHRLPASPHLLTNGQAQAAPRYYDYILATDWRPYGAPVKAMIEEIKAIKGSGKTVGVLQLEALRYMSPMIRPLCEPIQQLINEGVVDRIVPTDPAETPLLIIRYPPVLQFVANRPMSVTPKKVVILANQAPRERDGSDWRYVSSTCSANAEKLFGVKPSWIPEGPQTRQALEDEGLLRSDEVAPFNMPCILNMADWYLPRTRFRSDIAVLGRHSRDHYTKWPDNADTMLKVYPDDPGIDVRIMGGAQAALSVLGRNRPPKNWTSFAYDTMPAKIFLRQLDFWAYFHHPVLVESFGLAVLEAMASGCVVILPEHFEKTFGKGAVYCHSDDVRKTIDYYYSDFARYREQSETAVRHVREHFSYDSYLGLLEQLNQGREKSGA